MKAFFLLLLLIHSSSVLSAETHAGHAHGAGEECEITGSPTPAGTNLAADVLTATEKLSPDMRYCQAVQACGGWYQDSGLGFDCKISAMPTCNLEAREVSAIKYYTSSGYGCFNKFLWGREESPVSGGIEVLNEALAKLPKYEGFVMRGTNLPVSIRNQHQQGATVVYDAFTSTSTSHGFSGQDQFLIYSKTGRPVMSISSISGEEEVLFQSGTRFRIISVRNEGSHYYLMRELVGSETSGEAKKEDERILALARELKDRKSETPYSEARRLRRWECPTDGSRNPDKIKLEVSPGNIGSFL